MRLRRASLMAPLALPFVALALGAACNRQEPPHDHGSEHPLGHDHHAEGHGHGDAPVTRITRFTDKLELFAEHGPVVAGSELSLLAHLTVLEGFRPLEGAMVELELDGPTSIKSVAGTAMRPGIYRLAVTVPAPGTYQGRVVVRGSVHDRVEGFTLTAADKAAPKEAGGADEDPEHFIELLKEQQWGVPFATAFAKQGALIASIEVAGSVGTPPGGTAEIGAPLSGRVMPPPKGLPKPGESVKKGQLLATFAPTPGSPEEAARTGLAVSEAEARVQRAVLAKERAERLIRDHAIAERELEEARREVGVAEAALKAARNTQALFSGVTAGAGAGSWRLVAPIAGTVVDVAATPGAAVGPGTVLFRLIDTRELWIRARVPEQDAARLRQDRDASFELPGLADVFPIDVTGDDANASLVTVGRTVDPSSRTVEVIYALEKPDPRLRVGGLVRITLPAGDDFSGVVIPKTAVVDDEGREAVYVQVDGEHFEERMVRAGPRQGAFVGVTQGLAAGERIVVRGAHIVRLQARAGSAAPHGHIH